MAFIAAAVASHCVETFRNVMLRSANRPRDGLYRIVEEVLFDKKEMTGIMSSCESITSQCVFVAKCVPLRGKVCGWTSSFDKTFACKF